MSIAIDPSEMRAPATGRTPSEVTPRKAPPSRAVRLALLTVLGGVGLVGLSAGAYSMLSGLAGPPPSKVRMGRVSADWPDLRDGVPALASTGAPSPNAGPATAAPTDSVPERAAAAPVEVKALAVETGEAKPLDVKPADAKPAQVAAVETKFAPAKSAPAKQGRLPAIENAATVPPAAAVALVEKGRTAPIVAPSAIETTRARATTGGTFAALPPAPAAADKISKPKAAPTVGQAKPASKAAAKPAASPAEKAAAAQPAQAAEPEAEETEMFGMKVPSLAPVGRKFVDSVEALGNAVKRLPEQF